MLHKANHNTRKSALFKAHNGSKQGAFFMQIPVNYSLKAFQPWAFSSCTLSDLEIILQPEFLSVM